MIRHTLHRGLDHKSHRNTDTLFHTVTKRRMGFEFCQTLNYCVLSFNCIPLACFLQVTDTLLEIVDEASHSSSCGQIGSLVQGDMGLERSPKRSQAQLLSLVTSATRADRKTGADTNCVERKGHGRIHARGTLRCEKLGNGDAVGGSTSGLCGGGSL